MAYKQKNCIKLHCYGLGILLLLVLLEKEYGRKVAEPYVSNSDTNIIPDKHPCAFSLSLSVESVKGEILL